MLLNAKPNLAPTGKVVGDLLVRRVECALMRAAESRQVFQHQMHGRTGNPGERPAVRNLSIAQSDAQPLDPLFHFTTRIVASNSCTMLFRCFICHAMSGALASTPSAKRHTIFGSR